MNDKDMEMESGSARQGFIQQVKLNRQLKAEIQELKKELDRYKNGAEAVSVNQDPQPVITSNTKELEEALNKIDKLNETNKELKLKVDDFQRIIESGDNNSGNAVIDANKRVMHLYKEKEALMLKVKKLEANSGGDSSKKIAELEAENRALEKALVEANSNTNETYLDNFTGNADRVNRLTKEKAELMKEVDKLKKELTTQNSNGANPGMSFGDTHRRITALQLDKQKLEDELNKYKNQYKDVDGSISKLESENDRLKARLEDISKNSNANVANLHQLEEQVIKLTEERDTLKGKLDKINKFVENNTNNFASELKQVEDINNKLTREKQELEAKLYELKKSSGNTEKLIKNAKESDQLINKLIREKRELTAKLDKMVKIVEGKPVNGAMSKEDKKAMDDLVAEKENLAMLNNALKEKIKEQEARIEELISTAGNGEDTDTTKELFKLRTKFENIQKNYMAAVQQNDELKYQLEALQQDKSEKIQDVKDKSNRNFA